MSIIVYPHMGHSFLLSAAIHQTPGIRFILLILEGTAPVAAASPPVWVPMGLRGLRRQARPLRLRLWAGSGVCVARPRRNGIGQRVARRVRDAVVLHNVEVVRPPPPCGAETVTRYQLPEPARPVTDPLAPSWLTVNVQPFRVSVSPGAP